MLLESKAVVSGPLLIDNLLSITGFTASRGFPCGVNSSSLLSDELVTAGVEHVTRILVRSSRVLRLEDDCALGSEEGIDEVVFL